LHCHSQPLRAAIRETWRSLVREQEYGFCDGIRGLAMLWVCACHGIKPFVSEPSLSDVGRRLMEAWWPLAPFLAGEAGVDLFLVLSGFLIGGALYREASRSGRVAPGKFLLRRFFRLYPSLASTMVVDLLGSAVLGKPQTCPVHSWYNYLFVVNNILPSLECIGHTWSVNLKIQLYLVTLLVFLLASCASRFSEDKVHFLRSMALFGVFGWVACLAMRFWFVLDVLHDDQGVPNSEHDAETFTF